MMLLSDDTSPERIAKALAHLDYTQREVWWRAGAAIYSALGEAGKPIWEAWSQQWPEWNKRESDSQWKGLRSVKGIRIGSLFWAAREAGWRDDGHYTPLSEEEKAARHARWQAEAEQAEAEQAERREKAKAKATKLWTAALENGRGVKAEHEYIKAKGVRPYGAGQVGEMLVVPLYRSDGEHVNNQMIRRNPDGPGMSKRFHSGGEVSGTFLALTPLPEAPAKVVLCEGWATGCSLQEALPDLPVVVAWSAENLPKVAAILHEKYPATDWVVAGDRDASGAGQKAAARAVAALPPGKGWAVLPVFEGLEAPEGASDFNDLHQLAGLAEVRRQLMAAQYGPSLPALPCPAPPSPEGPDLTAGDRVQDADAYLVENLYQVVGKTKVFDAKRKIVMTAAAARATFGAEPMKLWQANPQRKSIEPHEAEMLFREAERECNRRDEAYCTMRDRYVHLDGSDDAWDCHLKKQITSKALRAAMGSGYKLWLDDPLRRVVRLENLVFDPTAQVGAGYINTFDGLPDMPVPPGASCSAIQDLLADLCGGDASAFAFVEQWLALQLQQPGTKMESALLFHSEHHGAGKGLFFEYVVVPMFGDYANIVGQNEMESGYSGWAASKLFLLFEEISAPGDARKLRGRIKHMVTGRTQQIERKFLETRQEANYANLVYLSNEEYPMSLEPGDRRFLVIWPPHKIRPELRAAVTKELEAGGVAAYRQYLLGVDLSGFSARTEPPMTVAKRRLIERNLPDWMLFYDEWRSGGLGLPFVPVRSVDLFSAYLEWAARQNSGSKYSMKSFSGMMSSRVEKELKRYRLPGGESRVWFFLPPESEQKYGEDKDFLGRCVTQFREAAAAAGYKVDNWQPINLVTC